MCLSAKSVRLFQIKLALRHYLKMKISRLIPKPLSCLIPQWLSYKILPSRYDIVWVYNAESINKIKTKTT